MTGAQKTSASTTTGVKADSGSRLITSRFHAKSTALEVVEGVSLAGRQAVVTGGAAGLGLDTSRALVAAGASLTLAVRNTEQGRQAADQIRLQYPKADITVSLLDLGSLSIVSNFAAQWVTGGKVLDILVNNAGIMACPLTRDSHGWEIQFATNHLAHFALTTSLLPALRQAAKEHGEARVVVLTSAGHKIAGIDFDDIHFERREYDKWQAYGQAKTANALFSLELNAREAENGVTANAVHPGGIMTGLQKFLPVEEMKARGWLNPDGSVLDRFKTTEQGASTSVWAATALELKGHGGLYLEDCRQGVPSAPDDRASGYFPHIMDREAARRLWMVSDNLVSKG